MDCAAMMKRMAWGQRTIVPWVHQAHPVPKLHHHDTGRDQPSGDHLYDFHQPDA